MNVDENSKTTVQMKMKISSEDVATESNGVTDDQKDDMAKKRYLLQRPEKKPSAIIHIA